MPSARIVASYETRFEPTFDQSTIPLVYGNKLILVAVGPMYSDGKGRVFICDVTSRRFSEISFEYPLSKPHETDTFRLINYVSRGNIVVIRGISYLDGNTKISDIVVVLDVGNNIVEVANSDNYDIGVKLSHGHCSQVLYPTSVICSSGGSIVIVDVEHMKHVNKSVEGSPASVVPSHKIMMKQDDVHMIIGAYSAGEPFKMFSMYLGKVIKTITPPYNYGYSTATIGGAFISTYRGCSHNVLIPLIDGLQPDSPCRVGLCDDEGNTLTVIHPNPRRFTYPNYHGGFHIIGTEDPTTYHIMYVVSDNSPMYESKRSICYMKIDLSNYSVTVNKEILRLDNETLGGEYYFGVTNMFSVRSCWAGRPLIDIVNKKIYTIFTAYNSSRGTYKALLIEVDISDINVSVWNTNAWYIA